MVTIGVLAIQGAVEEHVVRVQRAGATAKEVRNPVDLEGVDGMILPGGESTAMSIVGEQNGIFPALKQFVQSGKPAWGTCAGMILLSDHAIKKANCGQTLIGGLDVHVCRNFFGSQAHSSILPINLVEGFLPVEEGKSAVYKSCFIRAPAILKVGPGVRVLGTLKAKPHTSAVAEVAALIAGKALEGLPPPPGSAASSSSGSGNGSSDSSSEEAQEIEVTIAVQQGNILATAFHPELMEDLRWHRYFVGMVETAQAGQS